MNTSDLEARLAAIEARLDALEQKGPRKERERPIPHDWQPRDEDLDWCKEALPHVDGEREAASFKDYWISNGGKKVQWDAAFRNWCRKTAQLSPSRQPVGAARPTGRAAATAEGNRGKRDRVLDQLASLLPRTD